MRIAITSFIKWLRPLLASPVATVAKLYPNDFQTDGNREPVPPTTAGAATLWLLSSIGDGPSSLLTLGYMVLLQLEYLRADGQTLLAAEHLDAFNEVSGLVLTPKHSIVTVPRADYSLAPPKDLGEMVLKPADKVLWRNGPLIVDPVKEVHKLATLELHFRRNH